MYIVAIGWIYIALMMAVVEAFSSTGTVLGAVFTFLLYGALPVSIVLYLINGRYKGLNRRRAQADGTGADAPGATTSPGDPHAGGETPAAPATSGSRAVRKEA